MSLREKFEMENQECCGDCFECHKQDILNEYLEVIMDAKDEQEVRELLEELFDEAVEMVEDDLEEDDDEDEDEDYEYDELGELGEFVGDIEGVCDCGDSVTINGDVYITMYGKSIDEF